MLGLSAGELTALLTAHGIDYSGCIEKAELQRLARACSQQSNVSEASLLAAINTSEEPLPASNLSEEPLVASNAPEEPPCTPAESNAPEVAPGT